MAYEIEYAPESDEDLVWLTKHHGKDREVEILESVPVYLTHQPTLRSHKRKPMAPNPLGATWELRLGDLRVYYDIDEAAQTVWILRAGIKRRDRVIIQGVEIDLRAPA